MARFAWVLALVAAAALPARSQQLYSRRTDNLNLIYYDKAHEYLSYHLARCFENSLAFHRQLFDYTPSGPVAILMQDFGDYGHGGTSTVPGNYINIGIEPFDYVYDTMPANERMNWLMHHELVHVVATDKASGSDLRYRALFRGKVAPDQENPISMAYSFLTSPRWYSPRWYHEGIAVFLETWMAGGIGRVLGGYDEMVFRTMALENAYFYDVVGLESEGTTIDFQVGQNSYLYGTRFVSWLAATRGPEKIIEWFDRRDGSERYFSAQFRKVYGMPLEQAWREWVRQEKDWQRKNLQRIRAYPLTELRPITPEVLGSVSRSFVDRERNRLYAAVNRPAKPAQIVSIDLASGAVTPLAEVNVPALYFVTSLAWDPKGGKLFFTSDNSRGWRDIHELDLATGRHRLLLENARTGDLVVHPEDQAIWGIQHHNGYSSIVRIPPPYTEWQTLLTLEYGRDLFDIDIAPDGSKLTGSIIDVGGRQQLVAMDVAKLLEGNGAYEVLHEFEDNSPENFAFSPDGRYLYGTSYFTGVSNVFRYDFETKAMDAVSNVETGLFRPVALDDDTIVAWRYTATGFAPVRARIGVREDLNAIEYLGQQVAENYPEVKGWIVGSPARVDLDRVTTFTGAYAPLRQLGLSSVYPVLEGYKDSMAAGVRFNFADPLGLHAIDLTVAATSDHDLDDDESLHVKLAWSHAPWKVRLRYNATDFYDMFGPTKTSRKGHSALVSYGNYLVYERPRTLEYTLSGAYHGGLDTLPDYQNVEAPFEEYATAGARLDYRNMRRTIGAVDFERGVGWTLAANAAYVDSDFFPRVSATYDRGFMLPLDHSSIWLRGAAGKSWGDRANVFSSFFFGGFGNNWVDWGDVRRYRSADSFPGLEINEVGGTDYAKGTVEWTLPPLRFRQVGVPGLYTNWARLALFTSGLATELGRSEERQELWSAGGQIDLSLVIFSTLESTFSVGYARAFDHGASSDEFMVSLKLLR